MKKYRSGPPIDATVFVRDHGVVSVRLTLLLAGQQFSWQVVEETPSKKMASLVDAWMDAYCSHSHALPHVPVDLSGVPPYTRKVLLQLLELPFHSRVNYQELAGMTGNPRAARAVGNSCGRNPCPLIIPCHHVLASSSIGGYSLGIAMKKELLAFESGALS